jgi:subtilisin-like proprotein convertase family protein/subtilisin family serine protease
MNIKNLITLFSLILFVFSGLAQVQKGNQRIIDSYDQQQIKKRAKKFQKQIEENKRKAFRYALDNNIDVVIEDENGVKSYLEGIEEDNTLYYITTFNAGAASMSGVDQLYNGGSLALNLNGAGILAGVWDDGRTRSTHQALVGRVTHMDNASASPLRHSTHVTGTMISSGVGNASAKGMAFGGSVLGWDFFNDISEMQNAAGNGMIVSNHSYGLNPQQLSDWQFGAYLGLARSIDLITNSAPYYLPVMAAGNSRNQSPANNPDANGFDLITGRQVAKNALIVANALQVNQYTGPSSVQLSQSSSYGPTDDLRVKPDITAKGTNVTSTYENADNSFGPLSGTSMASPVVSGTVMLLQQLYFNLYGDYMKSHEVKALLTGTTLPAGNHAPGPDIRFGFGLMNAEAAAEVILNDGFTAYFDNITLQNNATFSETFTALGEDIPLEVTIAWNDPAGQTQPTGQVNVTDARLINDLDVRIFDEDNNEFFPYFIRSALFQYSTGIGDNSKDNIEKIHIGNPSGNYTIQVTHKGNLTGGSQDFAIVVTGVGEAPFNVLATNNTLEVCPSDDAVFEFNFQTIPSFTGEVEFTAVGLPSEIQVLFSSDTATDNETISFQLNNLSAVEAGNYDFTINASSEDDIISRLFRITVLEDEQFEEIEFTFPLDDAEDILLNPSLSWTFASTAQEFLIELSFTNDFNTVLLSDAVTVNRYNVPELLPETQYFWRVAPINDCLEGDFTEGSFTTETLTCEEVQLSEDTPVDIDDASAGIYEASISVEEDFVGQISKLKVHVDIEHTYVGDLILKLVSPSGTEVVLIDQVCDSGQNIDVIFDDSGEAFTCNPEEPAITGVLQPLNPLSTFINEDLEGEWTLVVEDTMEDDGGVINSFGVEFCDGTAVLSITTVQELPITIYPNPATTSFSIQFDGATTETSIHIYDINGRLVRKEAYQSGGNLKTIDVSSMNSGVYLIEVISGRSKTVKKLVKR